VTASTGIRLASLPGMTRPILYAGIATFVLALGGCENGRKRTSETDRDKVVVAERDSSRDDFVRDARARIKDMNARIDQLEAKADVESKQAAASLRARRDDLAARMDHASDVADSEWDQFKADLDRDLTELKTELDERF
jgi:hypothetical protein